MPIDVASEIVPGLWMSGSRAAISPRHLDRVVTMCAERHEHVAVPSGSAPLYTRASPMRGWTIPILPREWARRVAGWTEDGETSSSAAPPASTGPDSSWSGRSSSGGMDSHDAVLLIRRRRRADALNNPWFVEWLRREPGAGGLFAPYGGTDS